MHWIYIIKSNPYGKLYIGSTDNLVRRLKEHNDGQNKSTKPYLPWKIAYTEGYFLREDAVDRERTLKQFGKVYSQLKRRIKNSLRSA